MLKKNWKELRNFLLVCIIFVQPLLASRYLLLLLPSRNVKAMRKFLILAILGWIAVVFLMIGFLMNFPMSGFIMFPAGILYIICMVKTIKLCLEVKDELKIMYIPSD